MRKSLALKSLLVLQVLSPVPQMMLQGLRVSGHLLKWARYVYNLFISFILLKQNFTTISSLQSPGGQPPSLLIWSPF